MIVKNEKINKETGEITEDFLPEGGCDSGSIEIKSKDEKLEKHEIIVDQNLPFYKFLLKKITVQEVDKRPYRTAQIVLLNHISKYFLGYRVILTCDTEPLENKIISVEKARMEFEAQQQDILPDIKFKDLEKFDEQIRLLRLEIVKLIALCPDITFVTVVQKIDDSGDYTKVDFLVTLETANELNSAWENIPNYKIQLQHYST